jgi:hypothetical protein
LRAQQRNSKHGTAPDSGRLFYHTDAAWVEAAAEAVKSRWQLLCAIRLYRLWKAKRCPPEIVASNVALVGGGVTRWVKVRTLKTLEAHRLIKTRVPPKQGAAPHISITLPK